MQHEFLLFAIASGIMLGGLSITFALIFYCNGSWIHSRKQNKIEKKVLSLLGKPGQDKIVTFITCPSVRSAFCRESVGPKILMFSFPEGPLDSEGINEIKHLLTTWVENELGRTISTANYWTIAAPWWPSDALKIVSDKADLLAGRLGCKLLYSNTREK